MAAVPSDELDARAPPIYLFNQDRELRYTWVSRIPDELARHVPARIVGHTDAELCEAVQGHEVVALKRDVLRTGVRARRVVTVSTPARTCYFDLTIEPVRDGEGLVTGLACAAFEVTAHRETEAELRRMQGQMAEAEKLARIGSWLWDVEADRIYWSPGLYTIYGITTDAFDPRFAARQREQRVHPDDHERVEHAVASALATARPFDIDYRILRPDGRVRILHGRCEPVVNESGKVVRLVGTAQDVTEVRLAEDALETTARELGERAVQLHRLTHGSPGNAAELPLLRPRQVEILELIAEGLSNFEIGERLFISEATVKWHVRQTLKALGVANRAQAVARVFGRSP